MAQQSPYHVIIVGAGLVGSTLACQLNQLGLRIAIVDQHIPDINRQANLHSRALSLNHTTVNNLKQIEVWDGCKPYAQAIEHVHVSQANQFGSCQFYAEDYDCDALGYVVPFDVLTLALNKKTMALEQSDFFCSKEIISIEQTDTTATLQFKIGKTNKNLEAYFIFGCDGTHSSIAEFIQSKKNITGTTSALAATISSACVNHTAYERFTTEGTVAILPRQKNQAGMIVTGTEKQIETLNQLSYVQLMQRIQHLMGDRLSPKASIEKTHTMSLQSIARSPSIKDRVCLLGNAKRTMVPIAAQGFNLAMRDLMQLTEVFKCAKDYDDLSNQHILSTFTHARQQDQTQTKLLVERTEKLFNLNFPGTQFIKGLSLYATDLITPIKTRIAKRALGQSGKPTYIVKLDHENA